MDGKFPPVSDWELDAVSVRSPTIMPMDIFLCSIPVFLVSMGILKKRKKRDSKKICSDTWNCLFSRRMVLYTECCDS